jgi:endoplasmic reticulum lectin 1
VDQYHVEKDGTKTVIHLGKFDKTKHLEWLEKNPHKRPKPLAVRKQITHFYADGTLCDKTGRPRQTEVFYSNHYAEGISCRISVYILSFVLRNHVVS